jgi:hypothetical protein
MLARTIISTTAGLMLTVLPLAQAFATPTPKGKQCTASCAAAHAVSKYYFSHGDFQLEFRADTTQKIKGYLSHTPRFNE